MPGCMQINSLIIPNFFHNLSVNKQIEKCFRAYCSATKGLGRPHTSAQWVPKHSIPHNHWLHSTRTIPKYHTHTIMVQVLPTTYHTNTDLQLKLETAQEHIMRSGDKPIKNTTKHRSYMSSKKVTWSLWKYKMFRTNEKEWSPNCFTCMSVFISLKKKLDQSIYTNNTPKNYHTTLLKATKYIYTSTKGLHVLIS